MTGPKLDWMTRPSHTASKLVNCHHAATIKPPWPLTPARTTCISAVEINRAGCMREWMRAVSVGVCYVTEPRLASVRVSFPVLIVFECWLFVKETKKRRFSFGGTNISAVSAFRAASAVSSSATDVLCFLDFQWRAVSVNLESVCALSQRTR